MILKWGYILVIHSLYRNLSDSLPLLIILVDLKWSTLAVNKHGPLYQDRRLNLLPWWLLWIQASTWSTTHPKSTLNSSSLESRQTKRIPTQSEWSWIR